MSLLGYRIIIFGLAAWITLCLPSFAFVLSRPSSGYLETLVRCGAFLGFGLVPVAAFGLWRERPWGFWLLVAACAYASIIFAGSGFRQLLRICALHYMMLAVVLLRRLFPYPRSSTPKPKPDTTGNP